MKLITVTQDHIAKGQPGNQKKCPIALALADQGFTDPWVSKDRFSYKNHAGNRIYLPLTAPMKRFTFMFDLYGDDDVEPTTFNFDEFPLNPDHKDRPCPQN